MHCTYEIYHLVHKNLTFILLPTRIKHSLLFFHEHAVIFLCLCKFVLRDLFITVLQMAVVHK